MKEMTIKQPEAPKIKINGHVFQIRKTDIEILRMVQEAQRKYEGRDISGIDEAVEAASDLVEMLDGILGKGAVKKLTGREQPGLAFSYKMLAEIARGAVEACAQALVETYE